MRRAASCGAIVVVIATAAVAQQPPWLTNTPIVNVHQELYLEQQSGHGIWAKQFMAGPGLERIEIVSEELTSDVWINLRSRVSSDNGRTWSDWQTLPNNWVNYNGVQVWEGDDMTMPVYDPIADVLIQPFHRLMDMGGKYYFFANYRLSHDHGLTWSQPKQLKYEPGPDFNPNDPLNQQFLASNHAYPGQKFLLHSDGGLVFGVGHANALDDPLNDQRRERLGALAFHGQWNSTLGDYEWTAGDRISISPTLSSRGLQETDVAELDDGRTLFVWRGSDTSQTEGHKWFSISDDYGQTLSPVSEWTYDDGTPFYSPSSFHRLFHHEGTDRLYWIGNISPTPPSGNSPRYPLVIGEVDRTSGLLKKDTISVIADREPHQSSLVQFSNFSLLENPEDSTVELLISHLQADGNAGSLNADVYKYTLNFNIAPTPDHKDSSLFTHQYNGGFPVTGYQQNGPFASSPSSTDGVLSYRSTVESGQGYFKSNEWDGAIDPAVGWTLEVRLKIGTDAAEGPEGAFDFTVTDGAGASGYRVFYVGQDFFGTRYAEPYDTGDNTDDFHVFRVAKEGGSDQFTVWRDGVKVGETTGFSDPASLFMYWGDGGGLIGGPTVEIDYFRFDNTGAYAPIGSTIVGDFTGDGFVDGEDLAQWMLDFGQTGGSDADGDGDSDGNDFLVWQRNVAAGADDAAPVPEPGAVALALAATSLLLIRQKQFIGGGRDY